METAGLLLDVTAVARALKLCRDGNVVELATLPLAYTPLVETSVLNDAPLDYADRGRVLMSVLRWAVDCLRPAGTPSWSATAWQAYLILHAYYINSDKTQNPYICADPAKNPQHPQTQCYAAKVNVTFADLAEWMYIEEATVFARRQTALDMVTAILRTEITTLRATAERRRYVITDRYDHYPPLAQRLLRFTAIFRHPIALDRLCTLADIPDAPAIQEAVLDMRTQQWLIGDPQTHEVLLHPQLRAILLYLLTAQERREWQHAAGQFYAARGDYLEAAYQFHAAGFAELGAQLLITHAAAIMRTLQIETFYETVSAFRASELPANVWAQLKIIAGQLAELSKNLEAALVEYGAALDAPDATTRAEAYYRRGKVLEGKNLDEALAHYDFGIQELQAVQPQAALLPEMYIHRAWIFIQGRPDFARAANDLQQAQSLLTPESLKPWVDLHNAWGELYNRQQHYAQAINHRLHAWLGATRLQNLDQLMKIAHNLGMDYAYLQDYERALFYLQQGATLARQVGNLAFAGACLKGIGNCHFWRAQYADAVTYYEQAYAHFKESGNRDYLGRICYDLTEVHLQLNDLARATAYQQEGLALAHETGDQETAAALTRLIAVLPSTPLAADLNPRQQQALIYLATYPSITNKEYRVITHVSARQANRDLAELVEKGLITKNGEGAATSYQRVADDGTASQK